MATTAEDKLRELGYERWWQGDEWLPREEVEAKERKYRLDNLRRAIEPLDAEDRADLMRMLVDDKPSDFDEAEWKNDTGE